MTEAASVRSEGCCLEHSVSMRFCPVLRYILLFQVSMDTQ